MSYYRPSFSQTVAMTRGRGFSSSRSSYRGSSGRGGSWGGGRGGYGSRGNSHFSSFSNSYDSRSKYGGSSDRYSNSRGHEDYRKSYRSEPSYGGRDSSGHRSPDRKRMRTEALSSRHESSGYGGDGSYNRYESSSYPPRRSFSGERRSASFSRREEFRKPSGPPPSSSPRGGYRGRLSSRGSRGSRLRDRPLRRRLVDSSYTVRRRIIPRSSDYARRLKLARLRSAAAAAARRASMKKGKSSGKEDSDDEKEENWDEIYDEKEKKEEAEKENGKADEEEAEKSIEAKSPTKEKEASSDKEDKKSESDSGERSRKSRFIKLKCVHCLTKCITFNKYSMHLLSSKHMAAMRRVAIKQKSILAQMRMTQRSAQRELEKVTEDLAPRTNFCPLCKLNYKQPKSTHQNSDLHKNMKKFLMPYCKTCKITFKSPMLYENHLCSIEHIKRKARLEQNGEKSDKDDSAEDDNLENFMTIDSVGDVDEEEGQTGKKKDSEPKKEKINVGIEQIRKVEVYYCDLCRMYLPRVEDSELPRVLSKHCKLRTHMQQYVRYKEDKDLAKHAERLQRKENAEKENKEKKDKEGNAEDEKGKEGENKKEEDKDKDTSCADDEDAEDNKLWADVDKDLGDILEAESGNKSSDEDDEPHDNSVRYDRFRYSEKAGDVKLEENVEDEEAKENSVAETAVADKDEEEK